jgi:hypothetical protein
MVVQLRAVAVDQEPADDLHECIDPGARGPQQRDHVLVSHLALAHEGDQRQQRIQRDQA